MKALSITPSTSEIIETDDPDWPTHRRFDYDSWEQLMGMSWESVNFCDEVEAAYQLFYKRATGNPATSANVTEQD